MPLPSSVWIRSKNRSWRSPFYVIILACLVGLWILCRFADSNQGSFIWINQNAQIFGRVFLECVTVLGDGLVACVLVLVFARRRPEIVLNVFISSLLVLAAVQGIKFLDASPRPLGVLPPDSVFIVGPRYMAGTFPSGHAATAWMLGGVMCLFFTRPWLRFAVVAGAALVAVSRTAVGVHWPDDDLAGSIIGWLAAGIGYFLTGTAAYVGRSGTKVVFQLFLVGCAVSMLLYDHTSYPYGFRFQQFLALSCLAVLGIQICLDLRERADAPVGSAESRP